MTKPDTELCVTLDLELPDSFVSRAEIDLIDACCADLIRILMDSTEETTVEE